MVKYDFTSSGGNIEHTCGNVSAYVNDLIQTWFEPQYFKTVNVATKIAYRYFDVLKNTKGSYFKNRKPFLIIQPRINPEGGEFLKGTMLTERIFPTFDSGDYGNLQPFLEDKEKGYQMKYMLNRLSMSFDVTIVTTTATEQRKVFFHLKNRQMWDKFNAWDTVLEAHIPREMIAAVSSLVDIPMNEPGRLLSYLNSHTYYPVTYKLKNSTGRDEYFRYYNTRIDAILTNLNMDDGSKDGLVDDSYGVTFTVNLEFFADGMYHMISKNPIPEYWNNGGMAIPMDSEETSTMEAMRMSMLLTPYRDMGICIPPGWRTYVNNAFQVTAKAPETDVTELSSIINPNLKRLINYHLENNITLDKLLTTFLLKDYSVLDPQQGHFMIDFKDLKLYTYVLNPISTYRILIVVNHAYANDLMIDLLGIREDK